MGIGVFIILLCCFICELWCWLSKYLLIFLEWGYNMFMLVVLWEFFEYVYMISIFIFLDVMLGFFGYWNYWDYFLGFYKLYVLMRE